MAYAKLLKVLISLSLVVGSFAAASADEPITEDALRLEDLAALLGTFQTLEIPLPAGVRSVYLAQARGDELRGLSGSSYGGTETSEPEHLRVVVGFPRPQSPFCGEGLLTLWIRMEDPQGSSVIESCYETPENYTGGSWRNVGAGGSIALEAWTPLFVYLPNVQREPKTEQEHFGTADPEAWLTVLLYTSDEPLEGVDPPSLPDLSRLRQELRLP